MRIYGRRVTYIGLLRIFCATHFLCEGTCRVATDPNKAPTISGLSGPLTLDVSASGTWTVQATDPENTALSYAVNWGDTQATSTATTTPNASFIQTTTFSHTYATAGTYTISVIVIDSAGLATKTITTVKVGNVTGVCTLQFDPMCGRPPGCANTCAAGMSCPAICQLYPVQTYGNRCQLDTAGAQFISNGQCGAAQ